MKYSERVVHRSKSKQKEDFQKVKIIAKIFEIISQNLQRWKNLLRHIYNTGRFNFHIMACSSGDFFFIIDP